MFEGTNKNYEWVCATLISAGVQLPIVESVFIQRGQIALWVYSTKSGKIKKNISSRCWYVVACNLRHFQQGRGFADSVPVCTALTDMNRTQIFLQKREASLLDLSNTVLQVHSKKVRILRYTRFAWIDRMVLTRVRLL